MQILNFVLGELAVNTYVIISGNEAAVIDPAGDKTEGADTIISALKNNGNPQLTHILLTHGHFDHTSAAQSLKEATGAKIYVHESDMPMLNKDGANKAFAAFFPQLFNPCEADIILNDGDIIKFGDVELNVMSTPGHSKGSVMFVDNTNKVIFAGDTLFENGIGRNDGWGASESEQNESLRKISGIQGEYRILCGHGNETTLEREKRFNPYLQ